MRRTMATGLPFIVGLLTGIASAAPSDHAPVENSSDAFTTPADTELSTQQREGAPAVRTVPAGSRLQVVQRYKGSAGVWWLVRVLLTLTYGLIHFHLAAKTVRADLSAARAAP